MKKRFPRGRRTAHNDPLVRRSFGRFRSRPAGEKMAAQKMRGFFACIRAAGLSQDIVYYLTIHIGEPIVAPRVAIGQAFVIEAEEMQDRRVEIVDVDRLLADGGA